MDFAPKRQRELDRLQKIAIESGDAADMEAYRQAYQQISNLEMAEMKAGLGPDGRRPDMLSGPAARDVRRPDMLGGPSDGRKAPRTEEELLIENAIRDRRRPDALDLPASRGPLSRRPDMLGGPAARDVRRPDMLGGPSDGRSLTAPLANPMIDRDPGLPSQAGSADYGYSMYEPQPEAPVAPQGRSFVRDSKGNPVLDSQGRARVFSGPAPQPQQRTFDLAKFFGK